MILVDTSVWVDHLRAGDETLAKLLDEGLVCVHPFVLGELACGNMRQRGKVLSLLGDLPQSTVARDEEVLLCIERQQLMGKGIGYLDAHLLASTLLEPGTRLWTRDARLRAQAGRLGISHERSG